MPMRLGGLTSGVDTDSIIQQLVKARRTKVDAAVKAQTKLEWKQTAWKELNAKIVKLYNGTLSSLRFEGNLSKKTATASKPSAVSILAGENAQESVQSLQITALARSAYMTGAKLASVSGQALKSDSKAVADLGMTEGAAFSVTNKDTVVDIHITADTTIADIVGRMKEAGINASFDAKNQRFFLSARAAGSEGSFSVTASNDEGASALEAMGVLVYDDSTRAAYEELSALGTDAAAKQAWLDRAVEARVKELQKEGSVQTNAAGEAYLNEDGSASQVLVEEMRAALEAKIATADRILADWNSAYGSQGATVVAAQDARIVLNGAEFTSSSNTFEINGLTLTVSATTEANEEITVTTKQDTDGIYNTVKTFLKEYNALINEMDKLYNADSARKYEPLTDEEKEAMSESQIEKWEKTIKDSLLRKDTSLGIIASTMKQTMAAGVSVGGEMLYLSGFGIETASYSMATENERNAYHIAGDSEDSVSASQSDKLKNMIATDPDTVVSFFNGLAKNLYSAMWGRMKSTDYSSAYNVYDDKRMKTEYSDYTAKISNLEKKLQAYEDKWYKKFAAMEKALTKLNSNSSALSGLLGG